MTDDTTPESRPAEQQPTEPVWTFRGLRLSPSEFNTAMVHFYRGEVQRSNVWRTRLDSTTNWAVVTTAAALTFTFGAPANSHAMIILTTILVTVFLLIESRRYRYYELWASRVRLMETDFFAAMLVPPYRPDVDWAQRLAGSLLRPEFPITELEAVGRRFRRNYAVIFATLALAWVSKVSIHPEPARSWQQFLANASVGTVPGWWIVIAGALYYVAVFAIGWLTAEMHDSPSEVLPRYPLPLGPGHLLDNISEAVHEFIPQTLRRVPRRTQLAYIVTDKSQRLGERLMHELVRGVTALNGTGMYTGRQHTILLCAVAPTEVAQLKAIVRACDPDAFMIITSAQEVLGRGFRPIGGAGRNSRKDEGMSQREGQAG